MCDSGRHAHPLDHRENIPNVCVFGCLCGCMWVCDTWELGAALLRQVDHPGCPVLTGWYVSFSGGCWAGHTVVMPAWLMARYLSFYQSGQVHSPVHRLHDAALKRATEQDFTLSGHEIPLFIAILQQTFLSIHLKACITMHEHHRNVFHMWPNHFKMMHLEAGHSFFLSRMGPLCRFDALLMRWRSRQEDYKAVIEFQEETLKPACSQTWVYSPWLLVIFFSLWIELSLSSDEMSVASLGWTVPCVHNTCFSK